LTGPGGPRSESILVGLDVCRKREWLLRELAHQGGEILQPEPASTAADAIASAKPVKYESELAKPAIRRPLQSKPTRQPKPVASPEITIPPSVETPAMAARSSATVVAESDVDELKFRLNYIRISDSIAIIDEVPYQQANKTSDASIVLLNAIMSALGVDAQPNTARTEVFNWPLMPGISKQGNANVNAQNALSGFIAMRQQTDKFKYLIVFVAQISELLMQDKAEAERDWLAENGNYYLTITHSLHSMLAHPILKRETWLHLQHLRHRLAAESV